MKPGWIEVEGVVCWALEDGRPYAEVAMADIGVPAERYRFMRYALTINPATGELVLAGRPRGGREWAVSAFQPDSFSAMVRLRLVRNTKGVDRSGKSAVGSP